MFRPAVPSRDSATGPTAEVYAQIKKAIGSVPNTFAAIGAHGPAALKAKLAADAVLAAGSLTMRDREAIKLVVSSVVGCDACVAAHSMLGKFAGLKPDELKNIRDGRSSDTKRDSALAFATITFTNVFNRINDTEIQYPAVT